MLCVFQAEEMCLQISHFYHERWQIFLHSGLFYRDIEGIQGEAGKAKSHIFPRKKEYYYLSISL